MPQAPESWPRNGPWIIAGTSADVDLPRAVAAIADASEVRVVALLIGERPVENPSGWVCAGPGLTVADVAGLVDALGQSHGLVLIVAGRGLLVPLGDDGWTLTDLAGELPAPVVLVTGDGPDAVNHTTLAIDALSGRGIPATVVTIGDGDGDDEGLPVTPAGRLSPGADRLDPVLHATADPAPEPGPVRTVGGHRVVMVLAAVFLCAVVLACGLAFVNRGTPDEGVRNTITRIEATPTARIEAWAAPVAPRVPLPPSADCPHRSIRVTRPGRADRQRVDAAWLRIETWLAAHAPKSSRELRPPATQATIDRTQRLMSTPFPPDLVASLLRHNGGLPVTPLYDLMPVEQIAPDWISSCSVLADEATVDGMDPWWDRAYVPFATAGDGGSLVADQRDGGHGRVGEFYPEDGTRFEGWPASVAELLERTATSLERGTDGAKVVDGTLVWQLR